MRFGLAGKNPPSQNPVVVAFHEWRRMLRDTWMLKDTWMRKGIWAARSFKAKIVACSERLDHDEHDLRPETAGATLHDSSLIFALLFRAGVFS